MRLLFYINTISHGGAERVMTNLATEMANRGHQCILVTSYKSIWEYDLGKKVHRISLCRNRYNNFIVRNIKTTLALRNVLTHIKPDIVISFMAEPNLRSLIAKIGLDIKTIISVRNDPPKEYPGMMGKIAKLLFSQANYIVFQTDDAKEWFSKRLQTKSDIIFNPVNPEFYSTHHTLKKSGIVTMGRLAPQKNHEMLIKAYSIIAPTTQEDLYIYGSGDSSIMQELCKFLDISNRVHFMGQCKNVPEVLLKSRLFVLSSNYEGMPNALMEAMASGIPCISTDCPCGGPKMLFPASIHDYLSPVGDASALANNMIRILTDINEEERVATLCRSAASKFKSEVVYDRWEKLIYDIYNINK